MARNNIPKFYDYDPGRQVRFIDPTIALANSNGILLARDLIEGASTVNKFGASLDISTDFVPVATAQKYQTPTAARTLELVSTSLQDSGLSSPLGSGAHQVTIEGMTDFNTATTETVTLNGQTPVSTSSQWLRVYRMYVSGSGSYGTQAGGSHVGTITLRDQLSPQNLWGQIDVLDGFAKGQSLIAAYSVPAGKAVFVKNIFIDVESTKSADVALFVREQANVIAQPYAAMRVKQLFRGVQDAYVMPRDLPLGPYTGPCDIGFLARATAAAGTTNISITFDMAIYDQ